MADAQSGHARDRPHRGAGEVDGRAHRVSEVSRCMNIPARYATGYLGDIGVPQDPAQMDFHA
ncbi:hypothetical protein FV241_04635 [Methylobacterium sp. WL2]|nr:hypothetical protein FVA80_20640 [Methylobacterium sp. WL1]TXN58868.1 hypothetical protein FV241_04635 [Methylobacterium sp. WL2]